MSNEDLDKRIARELMGWKLIPAREHKTPQVELWDAGHCQHGFFEGFNPTENMGHAYIVLEKIRNEGAYISIVTHDTWEISVNDGENVEVSVYANTLPLAISKLAEAIMNSPEHMRLFK